MREVNHAETVCFPFFHFTIYLFFTPHIFCPLLLGLPLVLVLIGVCLSLTYPIYYNVGCTGIFKSPTGCHARLRTSQRCPQDNQRRIHNYCHSYHGSLCCW